MTAAAGTIGASDDGVLSLFDGEAKVVHQQRHFRVLGMRAGKPQW
jgi:hypothetical protein